MKNSIKTIVISLALWALLFDIYLPTKSYDSSLEDIVIGPFLISQDNSLLPISTPPKLEVKKRIAVVVTAYSSTPEETDEDPYTTASGSVVKDGTVANNLLRFGTKVRLPELFGEKIFVVEDRMSSKKGDYHFDIWFEDKLEALEFGAKNTYVEIIASL